MSGRVEGRLLLLEFVTNVALHHLNIRLVDR